MLRTSFKEDLLGALDVQRKDFKEEMRVQGVRFEEKMTTSLLGYTPVAEFRSLSDRVDALTTQVSTLKTLQTGTVANKTEVSDGYNADVFQNNISEDDMPDDQGVSQRAHTSSFSKNQKTSIYHRNRGTPSTSSTVTKSVPAKQDQLGPEEYGLSEITPTDRRFKNVLSYRRYRLHDTTSVMSSAVSRNIGVWIRRLKHSMTRNIFDGKNPVAVLNFLGSYKKACDGEQVPECAALEIAPHFLDGPPCTEFEAMMEDANGGSTCRTMVT